MLGPVLPAAARPTTAQTAADRARAERAAEKLQTLQQEAARIDAQVAETSAELDRILAEEKRARERLNARARTMYRLGDASLIQVLLGATSFQDLATRWDLLMRMNEQDAADLATLRTARKDAEQAAASLMVLQAEQAKAVDAAEQEAARARKALAESEAALAAYEAQVAKQSRQSAAAAAPKESDPTQQLSGSGEWKTAVASHYGRNFTGRGASGERIGPYSMIVAHKTLPFGTLIEFEYNGKRAVAKVADRGPYTPGRTFDLGPGVVRALGFSGVHEVRYRIID